MVDNSVNNIKKLITSVVERIEDIEGQKASLNLDIREIYKEAKGGGLIPKQVREMVKLRKVDTAKRQEDEYARDLYLKALGLIED